MQVYPNARRPDWPEAEFIVGNPPFIGGSMLRSRMMPGYAEALWRAHPHMNESADFVMYWWDRAAELLTRKKTVLRRFGLVTTNSISQVFQRRVMERHLNAKAPISLIFAIPDHPWTKATRDSAAVRIAMTVGQAGARDGVLWEVTSEAGLDTDAPDIEFVRRPGKINSDLSIGQDLTKALALTATRGLCSRGVALHGLGFLVPSTELSRVGYDTVSSIASVVKPYQNGRDVMAKPRNFYAIDFQGMSAADARSRFPAAYQWVLERVKPERDRNNEPYRREHWWLFGRTHQELRDFIAGTGRYILTVETQRNRVFIFESENVLSDNKCVCIGLNDAWVLSVLSSRAHVWWATSKGGWLGAGNDPVYVKSSCFDPFPFPDPNDATRTRLSELGEELDATRKAVQAEHADLTLTGLYNVLEKLKAGEALSDKEADIKDRGRVLILKDLHDQIDRATADAYGWPHDLSDEQILERLVALNAERAAEEAAGHVRWLRPDYQIPRFARGAVAQTDKLDLGEAVVAIDKGLPRFPTDKGEQVMAIRALLLETGRPLDAAAISRGFKGGGKRIEQRVHQALTTLVRYGEITLLPNGQYVTRRAA